MSSRVLFLASVFLGLMLASCGGGSNQSQTPPNNPPPTQAVAYTLVAWSELGMHCMDGKDYSVFAVLPPFNTIHAQLIKNGATAQLVSTGVTVTYEAMADTAGSIKTARSFKAEDSTKSFVAGYMIGCFDCHNGPSGG
jgi:hypothetical protein